MVNGFPAPTNAIALRLAAWRFSRIVVGGALAAVVAALATYATSLAASTPVIDLTKPETVFPAMVVIGLGAGVNALAKFLREKRVITESSNPLAKSV